MKIVNLTGKPVTVETVVLLCLGCERHHVPLGSVNVKCPECGCGRYGEVSRERTLPVAEGAATVTYGADYRLESGLRIGYKRPLAVVGLPKPVMGTALLVTPEVAAAMQGTTNDRNDLYTIDMDGAKWSQKGRLESVPGLLYVGLAVRR